MSETPLRLIRDLSDDEWVDVAVAARERGERSSWDEADAYVVLRDRGWTQERVAAKCKVDQPRVSRFERCARKYVLAHNRPSFWTAYEEFAQRKSTAERLVASDENEWYTPAKYVASVRKVMGGIDLDPASCEAANATVEATTFYETEGLEQPWSGRVFLNPPYGRLAGDFATRLVDEYEAGRLDAAVLLVNAHCTDTDWFQRVWTGTLCFTDHRIDFDSGQRDKTSTSTHGSVFAYFGPDGHKFADEFARHGVVVRRWPG